MMRMDADDGDDDDTYDDFDAESIERFAVRL